MPETNDLEACHLRGNQQIKFLVICTICGLAWLFALTSCYLALRQLPIPPEIKDFTILVFGVISGSLIKTGVDRMVASGTPADPVNVAQTAPVEMVNAPGDAIETKPAPDTGQRDGADFSNVS